MFLTQCLNLALFWNGLKKGRYWLKTAKQTLFSEDLRPCADELLLGVLLSWRESRLNPNGAKGIYSQGAGADSGWIFFKRKHGGRGSSSVELVLEIVHGG